MRNIDLKLWIEVLRDPKETFRREKDKGDIKDATFHMAIAILLSLLIFLMPGLLSGNLFLETLFSLWSILTFFIIRYFIFIVITFIEFIFAKFLGGTGNFNSQIYLSVLFSIPFGLLYLVLYIINLDYQTMDFISIIMGLIYLYYLTIMLKVIHDLNTIKAIVAWLLPSLIVVLI